MGQGYYDREDESISMRKRKHRTKRQLKDSRDESYGDWGKRGKDWKGKKHSGTLSHQGAMKVLKHMNHIKFDSTTDKGIKGLGDARAEEKGKYI